MKITYVFQHFYLLQKKIKEKHNITEIAETNDCPLFSLESVLALA